MTRRLVRSGVQGSREGPAQFGRETGLASSSAQFGRLYGATSYFRTGATGSAGAVTLNGIILRSWVAVHVQAIWSWSSNGVHPESPSRAMATARQLGRGDVVRFYAAYSGLGLFKI